MVDTTRPWRYNTTDRGILSQTVAYAPRWLIHPQPSCCGMYTVGRLQSMSCTVGQRNSAIKSYLTGQYDAPPPLPFMSDMPGWQQATLKEQLQGLGRIPANSQWKVSTPLHPYSWAGGAVPVELVFFALLQEMAMLHTTMFFFTDNIDGHGDVHNGPVSPRKFMQWVQVQGYGSIQTSGPITSTRTSRHIQSWIFVPNWDIIKPHIAVAKADLKMYIKELNNDKRIKGKHEAINKERGDTRKDLQKALSTGW